MAEEREHGSTHGCVVLVKLCGCLLVCFLFPHIKKHIIIYIYTCIFILKYDCLDIIGVMQHKNVICLVYVCLVLYNEFWLNMYLHSDEYTYICICIYICCSSRHRTHVCAVGNKLIVYLYLADMN